MSKELFQNFNHVDDPDWIIKVYFNHLYSCGRFMQGVSLFIEKTGYSINYDGCAFPDLSDSDPFYHFEGVKLWCGNDEIIISDSKFVGFIKQACKLFLSEHPEDEEKLKEILNCGKEYQIKI